MDTINRVENITVPVLDDMGYSLVRILFTGGARKTLQIMAERKDGISMTVDDCADISNRLSAIFDVEEPIKESYFLEISSPGLDRPLTKPSDFEKFKGFEAKIETKKPVNGRKRFRGRLQEATEENLVVIEVEKEIYKIPFADVDKAKLVLNDELLKSKTDTNPIL